MLLVLQIENVDLVIAIDDGIELLKDLRVLIQLGVCLSIASVNHILYSLQSHCLEDVVQIV